MSRVLGIGVSIVLAGLAFLSDAKPSFAAGKVVVSGVAWYDDNRNSIIDAGEEVASYSRIELSVYGAPPPPPRQPRMLTQVAADAHGRFEVSFEPRGGDKAYLGGRGLRDGYPYYPCKPEVACVGSNYSTGGNGPAQVPLDAGASVNVNLPLVPRRGVLERLRPGSDPDFMIPDGRFFTQTNGLVGDSALGFAVTDGDGVPFWSTWQALGLNDVGYPLSGRFVWAGYLTQLFQKAMYQWQPGRGIFLINLMDELHNRRFDRVLRDRRLTPLPLDPAFDAGKSWEQVVQDRLALLDANPALKSRYFTAPDPLLLYGLPTSRVEDLGPAVVIRTQRTVLQLWKSDTPWARAGDVTVANGGEIAKEMVIFPIDPLAPVFPP